MDFQNLNDKTAPLSTLKADSRQELQKLYGKIRHLKATGKTVNTYSGCEEDWEEADGDVLSDFMEYIYVHHPQDRPDWLEAFYQVFSWQFTSFHEGVTVYYENFYGESDLETVLQVSQFLQKNGYAGIANSYQKGIALCSQANQYIDQTSLIKEIDNWLCEHTKDVWDFCVDILEKNEARWKLYQ